ncbi:MAG: hypothetical protein NC300_01280 [Bacteroidales bacterium]|nr:hypothetical protein [Clostridium sp.]MCM1202757.1 hypothetical protein [Bacteroidales bacterium]
MISADTSTKTTLIQQIQLSIEKGDYVETDALVEQLCTLQGMAKNYPMPDSFLSQLEEKEQNMLRRKNQKYSLAKKAAILAMILTIACTGGFTAYAVVENMAKQRMENMPEEEKKAITQEADAYHIGEITCSRELTLHEKERMHELGIAYKEGLFPEGEMQKAESENQIDANIPCYVITAMYMYFPERELTDEELLQLIDADYKTNYALESRAEELFADEHQTQADARQQLQQEADANGGIPEEEAVAIAKEYHDRLFEGIGEEISDELKARLLAVQNPDYLCGGVTKLSVSSSIEAADSEGAAGASHQLYYNVGYYIGNIPIYQYYINAKDGALSYVMVNDFYNFEDEISISEAENHVQNMCQKAEDYLKNYFGVTSEYKEVFCSYFKNAAEDGVSLNRIYFWFTTEEGNSYKIAFDCKNSEFKGYDSESFDTYLQRNALSREDTTIINLK